MLQKVEGRITKIIDIEYISWREMRRQKEQFLALTTNAHEEIILVAGELNPSFYEDGLPEIIKNKLENNKDFSVKILFSKEGSSEIDADKAAKIISVQNPEICRVFRAFPQHIELYWAKRRPKYHFCIFDWDTLLMEAVHKPKMDRDVAIFLKNPNKVEEYKGYFYKMINSDIVQRINVDQLVCNA